MQKVKKRTPLLFLFLNSISILFTILSIYLKVEVFASGPHKLSKKNEKLKKTAFQNGGYKNVLKSSFRAFLKQ